MKHLFVPALLTVVLLSGALGCDAGFKINAGKAGEMSSEETSNANTEQSGTAQSKTVQGRVDLPHSQGRVFFKIDDYLAHLVKMGHQDRPFYQKVGPDRYQLNTGRGGRGSRNGRGGRGKPGRGGGATKFYTRADLMRKFGFSK